MVVSSPEPRWFCVIDGFVDRIYRSGCVQSVIVNTALLLVLALVVVRPAAEPHRVALALRFAPALEDAVDLEAVPVIADVAEPMAEQAAAAPAPAALEEPVEPVIAVAAADFDLPAGDPPPVPDASELLAEVKVGRNEPRGDVVQANDVAKDGGPGGKGPGGDGSGIGGELGRRLQAAGAKTGDVQVSIRWEGTNDIDVHVIVVPFGAVGDSSFINWTNRVGSCGGMLDVDANAEVPRLVYTPVENIFWGKGRAPYGRYTVLLHHFRCWSGRPNTRVEVAVLVDGQVQWFYPTVRPEDGLVEITSFTRAPAKTAAANPMASPIITPRRLP